jgi:hypothetical protein
MTIAFACVAAAKVRRFPAWHRWIAGVQYKCGRIGIASQISRLALSRWAKAGPFRGAMLAIRDPGSGRPRKLGTNRNGPAACQWAPDDLKEEGNMSRVALNHLAPDFSLPDFAGHTVSLSDFLGKKNVLLVFNRTFA